MFSGESCEAAGVLQGRAASQVDETAGVGRRPTGSRATLDGQHVRSCLARRHNRRRARDAQAHHDHVDRLVEANLADLKRRDRLHPPPRVRTKWWTAACRLILNRHPLKVTTTTTTRMVEQAS